MTEDLHQPTCRVIDILEALADNSSGLTLTQLARGISASSSTISPVMRTLLSLGYVDLNEHTMCYSPGIRTLKLSAGYTTASAIYSNSLELMRKVVQDCSETCQLGILEGSNVFYIAKIESPEPIRLVSSVGKSIPASCTAIGKALLCDTSFESLQKMYPTGLPRLTERSLQRIEDLYIQLTLIAKGDIATESGESLEHLCCFALPIRFHGKINAAISISAPSFRVDKSKEESIKHCLIEARKSIEAILDQFGHGLQKG